MRHLNADPVYYPFRGEQRFEDLLRRTGLPLAAPNTNPSYQPATNP